MACSDTEYMRTIKLSLWAKENAVTYQTALSQFHRDQVPGARRLPSGSIVVDIEEPPRAEPRAGAALYARVSTRKQEPHLAGQLGRLRDFAAARGDAVVREEAEIASGVNDQRPKLRSLLEDTSFAVLYVEYPDRLARFGRGWIEQLLRLQGREVVYLNESSLGDEESLAEDLITVVTSFCGRLYGRRAKRVVSDVKDILPA